MVDMINWMKVEDKVESMKRSKRSKGSKEIRIKMDLRTQKDAKARDQKKTPRFLERRSSKHTIVLRRKARLIRLRDVALHNERDLRLFFISGQARMRTRASADAKCRNRRYLATGILRDEVKRLDRMKRQ